MRVAFPIKENSGLDSLINDHFGVAETFLIVDTDTRQVELKENLKLSGESTCKTGIFKKRDQVDAVVTKCMGDGSQRNLAKVDIQVYQAQRDTIAENLDLLEKKELKLFHMFDFCQAKKNKKEGGCGHH
jgi:predicted Fe-Mo cluster-binding NifX family protein